jgi:hypothetical protein
MSDKRRRPPLTHFPSVPLTEIGGRTGKHSRIVSDVLSDLEKLDEHSALKIDLAAVGQDKAALRSALHRGARKKNVELLTASDDASLYVFRRAPKIAAVG